MNIYKLANKRHELGLHPYDIDISECYHCYYYNNNKLVHTVATEMEDKNFA
jgi:hypothetical protein